MGYESRVFIIDRRENEGGFVWGEEIARFDLCKMGWEIVAGKQFREVFKTPIDFDLDIPLTGVKDLPYRADAYGDICKSASISDVIGWLEKSKVLRDWKVAKLFYDFLKVLQEHENEYRELILVHYGY